MSYILDALRKSDQLRQRGAAPTLLLGQATAAAPRRPALLAYGVLALVLLGAGIAIGWLRPWQPEPAAQTVVAPKAQSELQMQNMVPAVQAVPAPMPAAAPAPAPAPARQHAVAGVNSDRQSAPPKTGATASKKAAPLPSVMIMAELPVAIQQELPPMSISVHAYSGNAAERLVGINNTLLNEGEDVAPGLKLEQITREGMILSYKGYRFRRGVK